jgi:hypothetical protein
MKISAEFIAPVAVLLSCPVAFSPMGVSKTPHIPCQFPRVFSLGKGEGEPTKKIKNKIKTEKG